MTEPELELLKVRLERVWSPQTYRMVGGEENSNRLFQAFLGEDTELESDISLEVVFPGSLNAGAGYCLLAASLLRLEWDVVQGCYFYIEDEHNSVGYTELAPIFIDHWMTFFRRGCWLCGFPIEATVREKAEWMQGFTHAELEAWALNF